MIPSSAALSLKGWAAGSEVAGEGTEGNWTDQIWAHLVQQLVSLFLWSEPAASSSEWPEWPWAHLRRPRGPASAQWNDLLRALLGLWRKRTHDTELFFFNCLKNYIGLFFLHRPLPGMTLSS